jgi:hypothetical protein
MGHMLDFEVKAENEQTPLTEIKRAKYNIINY